MTNVKPHSMRALVLDSHGDPFRITDVARLTPGNGQVPLRIKASGVNPFDTNTRNRKATHAKQRLSAILSIDLADVVEAVGPGVTDFKPSDEGYGMTGGGLQGSLAEFAAVDADFLRGLGEALPPEVLQEGFGHRDKPFLQPVVAVEVVVEGEEAVEVAVLGVESGLRLARHFGREVEHHQVGERRFRGLEEGWHVMGENSWHHQGGFGRRFLRERGGKSRP